MSRCGHELFHWTKQNQQIDEPFPVLPIRFGENVSLITNHDHIHASRYEVHSQVPELKENAE